jgi:hypothetical protein
MTNITLVLAVYNKLDLTKESYKQMCMETIKKYINKPKTYIIRDILQSANKWDVYSLSVLYIHIFGNISKVFSLKQTFINKITLELSKNIHPDPSKRSDLKALLEQFNILNNGFLSNHMYILLLILFVVSIFLIKETNYLWSL